jgi:hypothetical protein
MIKEILIKIIIVLCLCIGCFFYGRHSVSPVVQIKEVVKVEKQIETVTETITLPSGEKRTVTKVKEHDNSQTVIATSPPIKKPDWNFSLSKKIYPTKEDNSSVYMLGITYRAAGNLYLGGHIITDHQYFITGTYTF